MINRTALLTLLLLPQVIRASDPRDSHVDSRELPTVPPGFVATIFAREPLVRQPCSLAFDARGRLYVGMGPQYRNPTPETPGDSVVLVLDTDGDGTADTTKVFATGFNAVQGLVWHGRDLWVANAPDLTIVRDLDGDDEADEYIRVFTDLGNLEHGLHGLNWGPDGKLYMSKGNSKGLTQPGRIAPKPFRDLWGVAAPPGSPDFPPPQKSTKADYRHTYHDPADDWGREGGVLRCDDGGKNLEIVARGFRNPWDIASDSGFNWLGTDNDQTGGDRVVMPFFGAHFGWNHPWSSQWSDAAQAPTAPVSGPLFEGSGTGILFCDSPQFPPEYRGVFLINDWLRKTTFLWRPRWDGALLRPAEGNWEPFVQGGEALFRPTDMEIGPDGALWILGWGSGYGAEWKEGQFVSEGSVFRIAPQEMQPAAWNGPQRERPLSEWSVRELLHDFAAPLPVWRTAAQEELLRRGAEVKLDLIAALRLGRHTEAQETWTAWTLGRLSPDDPEIAAFFVKVLDSKSGASLNLRVQALRILAHRLREFGRPQELPEPALAMLRSGEPRLRAAAVQVILEVRQKSALPQLVALLETESDRVTFYAAWQTLRGLGNQPALRKLLADDRQGVRRGALLALLEQEALTPDEVTPLAADVDPQLRELAASWLRKVAGGGESAELRGLPLQSTAAVPVVSRPPVAFARNVSAHSQAPYSASPGGLRPGALPHTDRDYTLKQIPPSLQDMDFIQTANADDGSHGLAFLSFEAILPVRVHIAFDKRLSQIPAWARETFRPSGLSIVADHWTCDLYSRDFPAGHVSLGGNTDDGTGGSKNNYFVVLEPLPLVPPAVPTSVDESLELLSRGDRARGELLFRHRGGAGCFKCHTLGGAAGAFGPDLGTIGSRSVARHIVESIVAPSAVITEGFNLLLVETDAGLVHSGVLLEESGLSLTLGTQTGERLTIPKRNIESRKTADVSAMPPFAPSLQSQDVADLTAFLLTQKEPATPPAAKAVPFAWEQKSDRLVITSSGGPAMEFVFQDEKILRPYFSNVHAPGGLAVTRQHPPVAGRDATDHPENHPGIWLGFGDINGADFWRNKGRLEHVKFLEAPAMKDGRLTFATACRLVDAGGKSLGEVTNRFSLAARPTGWLLVWDADFHSDEGDLVFGDQEEMGFGARVATPLTEKASGEIVNSHGAKSAAATWGQPAAWCDYSGTSEGRRGGITLMAAPANFRDCWWHNRDYGVFVANPFGRAAMKQGDKSAVVVKRGESLRLRFGALLHSGSDYDPTAAFKDFTEVVK